MARDEQTKFSQHAELLSTPDLRDFDLGTIHGMASIVQSFNAISQEDEVLLALRTDKDVQFLRLNPEVVKHLGLSLLALGVHQKWFSVEIQGWQTNQSEH